MARGTRKRVIQPMLFMEAVVMLGWRMREYSDSFELKCDCDNGRIVYAGTIGCEDIYCSSCGKRMTNVSTLTGVTDSSWLISAPIHRKSTTRKRDRQVV